MTAFCSGNKNEITRMKGCISLRATATFIEVLAFLYWFFNTLQKYIYLQNSRCVLFWNHFFFHNDALLPPKKRQRKPLYKECKWNLWKVKYENVSKITVASAVTRPSTNHDEIKMFMNVSQSWCGKHSCTIRLCSPAEGSSIRIF